MPQKRDEPTIRREMVMEGPWAGMLCGVGRELAEKRPLSKNTQRHE
jgi:hypothetical protein